jgi:hypothetical protein
MYHRNLLISEERGSEGRRNSMTTYAEAKMWWKTKYQINREALMMEYGSVNKKFLLNRGWTRTAITRILGEPDRRLPMRKFRHDRPECRYDVARVLAAEVAGKIRFRRMRGSKGTDPA